MHLARTDAAAAVSFDEALFRAAAFAEAGADLTFLEAPESVDQMERYCAEVPGHKVANLVEDGLTPWISPADLTDLGYSLALYPVTMLLHAAQAMGDAAAALRSGQSSEGRLSFDGLRRAVGWNDYDSIIARYENPEEN